MTFWTVHVRPGAEPVLVREGFSLGAFCFGPLWLAAHRAWIPALLSLVAIVLILFLITDGTRDVLLAGLAFLLGLSGHDLRRWSLDHRGYLLSQVVAAPTEIDALARLLGRRPDLKGSFMLPEAAR